MSLPQTFSHLLTGLFQGAAAQEGPPARAEALFAHLLRCILVLATNRWPHSIPTTKIHLKDDHTRFACHAAWLTSTAALPAAC